jgi:uncharacterized protein YjbJ (UPF0337 family)
MFDTVPTGPGHASKLALTSGVSMKPVPATSPRLPGQSGSARGARLAISPTGSEHKEFEMNWDIVEGNWKQFRGKVKAQWGKLTDDHLDVIAGKRIELTGKIQEAYGVTKDEAEKQVKRFEDLN